MKQPDLIPHLFRTEFSKITSVLCRHLGIEHVEVAEDITSETFLSALETWTYKGIPENPVAWLYAVAKNKARNHILRDQLFSKKVATQLTHSTTEQPNSEIDLSEKNISDSQLQMLFTICHPSISVESQIALALRILCGFGNEEIASAFLTSTETINKRLLRAKEKLRLENSKIEFPVGSDIPVRLETVLKTLYLLFSEGYYSETNRNILRVELCLEAMRLTYLLLENEETNRSSANALLALMCFHASRFAARKSEKGEVVLYEDQDETLWNYELIAKGAFYLQQASQGNTLSRYHLEASIAYQHTSKADTKEKWYTILQLYNKLLQLEYSPMAALNRTFALSKVQGKAVAIIEAEKLNLTSNHFYFTLLGELYKEIDSEKARKNFEHALLLAKTKTDQQTIKSKIQELD